MITLTDQMTAGPVTLATIETLTKKFSERHDELTATVTLLDAELTAVKRKYLKSLRRCVNETAAQKLALHTAISAAPGLFTKPRTYIFHGVKVGFQKGKGGIDFADVVKTLALIRKTFGDDAPAYIATKEAPDKKMLADLPAAELKKLGVIVLDTGDEVVIKPTDTEVEKIVAALLKDAVEMEVAA